MNEQESIAATAAYYYPYSLGQQQLELMKKKCRYQQKLNKIEYQIQVQN